MQFGPGALISPQTCYFSSLIRGENSIKVRAGILTPGSSYWSRLPDDFHQWHKRLSSPVTAAGPFRIRTGFPLMSRDTLTVIALSRKRQRVKSDYRPPKSDRPVLYRACIFLISSSICRPPPARIFSPTLLPSPWGSPAEPFSVMRSIFVPSRLASPAERLSSSPVKMA